MYVGALNKVCWFVPRSLLCDDIWLWIINYNVIFLRPCFFTLLCSAPREPAECDAYWLIDTGYFYSASSSPLLLRGTPDIACILCRSFTPKRHRQLWAKDLPKVPTWWLERDSNPRPFGRKATNLPMSHHAPQCAYVPVPLYICVIMC